MLQPYLRLNASQITCASSLYFRTGTSTAVCVCVCVYVWRVVGGIRVPQICFCCKSTSFLHCSADADADTDTDTASILTDVQLCVLLDLTARASRTFFGFQGVSRWFGYRLDFLTATIITSVALIAVLTPGFPAASAGLVITYALQVCLFVCLFVCLCVVFA